MSSVPNQDTDTVPNDEIETVVVHVPPSTASDDNEDMDVTFKETRLHGVLRDDEGRQYIQVGDSQSVT